MKVDISKWELKTLGDVCTFKRGLTYPKTEEILKSYMKTLKNLLWDHTKEMYNYVEKCICTILGFPNIVLILCLT